MTDQKFCKDCRYCDPDTLSSEAKRNPYTYAQCDHPNADESFVDLVSGRHIDGRQHCVNQRKSPLDRHCQEEGKNFEAAS